MGEEGKMKLEKRKQRAVWAEGRGAGWPEHEAGWEL